MTSDEHGIDETDEADRALEDAATPQDPVSLSDQDDAPEADALEQHRELRPPAEEPPAPSEDRPEADAADQATGVGGEDDEDDRH